MPFARRTACTLALMLIAAAPATRPADRQSPATPAAHPAAALLAELDDPDFAVRAAAALQLNNLGGDALPVVQTALARETLTPESRLRIEAAVRVLAPRATREARDRRREQWEARLFHDAYDNGGKANSRYDAAAHRAIDAFRPLGVDPLRGPAGPRAAALAAFAAAVDAGCDDPLVHCLFHLTVGGGEEPGRHRPTSNFGQVAHAVRTGPYPPAIKFFIACRHADQTEPTGLEPYQFPATLLPAIAAMPGLPEGELDALADLFYRLLRRQGYGGSVRAQLEPFIRAYARCAPKDVGPLVLEGRALIDAAWDARNEGSHVVPPPEQMKTFHDRLADAERVLEKAFQANPADARAATLMVAVKLAQGSDDGGGRDAMEAWFKRACDADPDDLDACLLKLRYLGPGRPGSDAEMIAFGRECLGTRNWRAGLPHVLIRAHESLAEWSGDSNAYYARADVWRDIAEVYEGNVLNFPADAYHRTCYAHLAARCGHWDVAHQQFQLLGDRADASVFGSAASLEYVRNKAARRASQQP